ncbi:MAG: hypothetical protein KZQ76_08785, partial [Candidatus Thiodiazotropha sp. (ex Epidulcina cf. delphinae)]|nr:hypothetical protein [Candidatus Thiodiazotropha sp. (ex Epidulcina cf. delphinae)]
QAAYGTAWLIDIIQKWLAPPAYKKRGALIDKLVKITERWIAHVPAKEHELLHWLLARQLGVLKQKHLDQAQSDSAVSRLKNASHRITEVTDLLSATLLSADDAGFHEMIDYLLANDENYLLSDWVEIARFVKQQNYEVTVTEGEAALLLAFVRGKLSKMLDTPLRKAGDWSITETGQCDCADCKVLVGFLQSSHLDRKVWPLAKGRRQHVHQVIDGMGIPVTHKTERSGSPHKLHLRKMKQLFSQEQAQRVQLKKGLDDLAE